MPERRPRELAVPANHRGAQEPSPAATLHTAGRKASPLRQPLNEQASWPVTAQKRAAHADARRTSSGQRRKQGGEHEMTSPTRCPSCLGIPADTALVGWRRVSVAAVGHVPVQMWQRRARVPVQMWQRRAQPRCRCGRGEPSPGSDVAGVSPTPVQMWQGVSPAPVQIWQR